MICSSCKQKEIPLENNKENIWGFNPYLYETFRDLKYAFYNFYKNCYQNDQKFYNCYNEDGYTYTQWYSYVISKNNYKYKALKKQTLWLFYILSGYNFFKELIKLGKKEDPLHNTIHHFLKYIDNMGSYQQKMLNLLLEHNLSLDIEDGEGISGNDYIINKILSDEDLKMSKELTKQYKTEENLFFSHHLFDNFTRCEKCKDFVDKYQDMIKNKEKIIEIDVLLEKLRNIILKRKECIEIYKKYEKCKNSIDRHEHVINIYTIIIS